VTTNVSQTFSLKSLPAFFDQTFSLKSLPAFFDQTFLLKSLPAKGQRTCWKLGDIIIAMETPKDALIYTTDKHFKTICTALGRKLYWE